MSTRRRSDEALRVHTVSVRLAMDELQVLDERRQRMRRADYVRAAVLDRLPVLIPQADLPPVDVPIRSGSPGSRLLDGYVG